MIYCNIMWKEKRKNWVIRNHLPDLYQIWCDLLDFCVLADPMAISLEYRFTFINVLEDGSRLRKLRVRLTERDHAQNLIICYYDFEYETLENIIIVSLVGLKVRQQFEGSSFLQWFPGLQISHSWSVLPSFVKPENQAVGFLFGRNTVENVPMNAFGKNCG